MFVKSSLTILFSARSHITTHRTCSVPFTFSLLALSVRGSRCLWGDQFCRFQPAAHRCWEPLGSSPRASWWTSRCGPLQYCAWHPGLYSWNCGGGVTPLQGQFWSVRDGKYWIHFSCSPAQDGRCWDGVYSASEGMVQWKWAISHI